MLLLLPNGVGVRLPPYPPVLTALQTDSSRYVYKVRGRANMITDSFSSQHQVNINQGKKRIIIHHTYTWLYVGSYEIQIQDMFYSNNEPKIFFMIN